MKILWFSNTPCAASFRLLGKGYTKGGWLNALQHELVKHGDIELAIAFYWPKFQAPFEADGTRYFPVLRSGGKGPLQRTVGRILGWNNETQELERLMEVVKRVGPDVIHIHGTEENYGLIQDRVSIPVIVSLQGILSVIVLKYFAGIPLPLLMRSECWKNKLLALTIARRYREMEKAALRERRILAITFNVAGRTEWDFHVSRLLAPRSRYFESSELLRSSFFNRRWSKICFEQPLRVISTLGPGVYKGLETIVRAVEVLRYTSDLKVEWKVAGLSASHPLCRTVAQWLGVDLAKLSLHFCGGLDEEALGHLLEHSDIYCQTSHIENSPNSLCEAMLVGLPCVASAVGGTPSLLTHRKEGLLIQDGDPYALAGAVLALAGDFRWASGMGAAARIRALDRHRPKSVVSVVREMYETVHNSSCKEEV